MYFLSFLSQHGDANWTIPQNQRDFFDHLGRQLGYKSLDDFYKLSIDDVRNHGGKILLDILFDGSIHHALQSIYPEHEWYPWLFPQNVPTGFWNIKENQKRFMDWLGKKLKFTRLDDWYKITVRDLTRNGGRSLLTKYGDSPSRLRKLGKKLSSQAPRRARARSPYAVR